VQWAAKSSWNGPSITRTNATFADLDGDGDLDMLLGAESGVTTAYKNSGTTSSPSWSAESTWNPPNVGSNARPALADLDNDGDYDLLIGDVNGVSFAYENTGTTSSPIWTARSGWNTPDSGDRSTPALADLDGDGDYDLLTGDVNSAKNYAYENTGTIYSPTWTYRSGWNLPSSDGFSMPAFADLDRDGDYDVMMGSGTGATLAYENTGTTSAPVWTRKISWDGPSTGDRSRPGLADLDGDGDYDLILGGYSVIPTAYENTGSVGAATNTIFSIAVGGSQKLKVNGLGNLNLLGSIISTNLISASYNGTADAFAINQSGTGNIVNLKDSGVSTFIIKNGGFVGIGTTNPGYKLQVFTGTANGYVNTDGTWGSSSDINLKKNIFPVSSILNNILALNPVSYNFKTEKDGTISHIGFIAQEVEQLFPELVSTGPDGIKGISYAMFTPLLTKAIQQQQTQITGITENQNKIVNQLTGQLADQNLTVDSKLQLIGENLDNIQTRLIASLQEQIATDTKDIINLKDQIKTLQDQTKSVIDFQLAFNLDKVIIKDALGNISLLDGKITAKDIEVLNKIKATDIEATNSIKGDNIELGNNSRGQAMIAIGEKEVIINSTFVNKNSQIYLTSKKGFEKIYYDDADIKLGESFKVKIDDAVDHVIYFNWLIVK
jgi:hypothetical protein